MPDLSLIKSTSRHLIGHDLETFDVLGPTIEFLLPPEQADDACCLMRATLAPSVFVPLHSHEDFESFVVLSGEFEGLVQSETGLSWTSMRDGDIFHVPGQVKHAFRNSSSEPATMFVATTARMGRFFREIGRPVGLERDDRRWNHRRSESREKTMSKSGMGERKQTHPALGHGSLTPPSDDVVRHFLEVATKYGYWIASSEENASLGLTILPPRADRA